MLFGFVFTEILSLIFIIWGDFFVGIYTTSEMVAAYGSDPYVSRMLSGRTDYHL